MDFAIGDLVQLKTDHLQLPGSQARKLAPRWVGPFAIVEKISDVTMRLQLPSHWKIHPTFHVSLLKHHFGDALPDQQPVFTVDDAVEFEVEQIL